MDKRELAKKIAEALFTNGFKEKANRLELKIGLTPQQERGAGGWCFNTAVDQIERVLKSNG